MKELLRSILIEQRTKVGQGILSRDKKLDMYLPKIQSIIGPRRSGKSSLMRGSILDLLQTGVGWDKICYLSLEDERFRNEEFAPDLILQAFRELNPENPHLLGVYFFFDEIQYLSNWEAFVNRVHESISKQVFLTGSNSKQMHTEVASVLRGRSLAQELLPLSFSEYLQFRNIAYEEYGEQRARVISAFQDYLMNGGFPETVNMNSAYIYHTLQEYFNTILFRDIIDISELRATHYLRYLLHRIAANTGKNTAIQKIYNELKSKGYSVSKNSLYDLSETAEAVYLFKQISKYDSSLIKRENSEKKSYFIDTGMLNALNSKFLENKGALLETLVFWQLYRMYGTIYEPNIYYYKDSSYECDFIVLQKNGKPLPIQVCYDLNDLDTRHRELKAILKASKVTKANKALIISLYEEEILEFDNVKVEIIPAWKFCARRNNTL